MRENGPSLARYAKPEEIADAISFFASPDSRYVSGQVLLVDGADNLFRRINNRSTNLESFTR
ncbi:MAG: SDR family oxidoreductase [Porticoccaceae bacterium]